MKKRKGRLRFLRYKRGCLRWVEKNDPVMCVRHKICSDNYINQMPKGVYKRKITRKGIVRKLDKIVGDIVKKRDKRCVCCTSSYNLQPGHLFSRVGYSTRWDLKNVFVQCQTCNFKHTYDPYPLTNYFLTKFGKKAYDKLHLKYVIPQRFTTPQLVDLYDELKLLLDTMDK